MNEVKTLNYELNSKIIKKYILFLVVFIGPLLPMYFRSFFSGVMYHFLMICSMMIMILHVLLKGPIFNLPILLISLSSIILIPSTILNKGPWLEAFLIPAYLVFECIFLTSITNRETDFKTYLLAVRDITVFFAIISLFYSLTRPQGLSYDSYGYAVHLYGNVNSITRYIMPGLCCSLIIDAKNKKRLSIKTIIILTAFFYVFFQIYHVTTGLVGIIILLLWFFLRKILCNNYKKAYFVSLVSIVFVEFMVVFLFGKSVYGELISNFFVKQGFSGRELLWRNILNLISQDRMLVLGNGIMDPNRLFFLIGNPNGSHNYYLDVLFQRGYLGLILLIILFLIPLFIRKRQITEIDCILLGVCCSYLTMFLMEPFLRTEILHLPIFCITMSFLLKKE